MRSLNGCYGRSGGGFGEPIDPGAAPIDGRRSMQSVPESSFANKVADSLIRADSALVRGTLGARDGVYCKTVTVPDGETITVIGKFHATKTRRPD